MSDTIKARINPLSWIDIDISEHSGTKHNTDLASLVAFLISPETQPTLETAIKRYKEIHKSTHNLFLAPEHPEILQKLIWPLQSSKSSYVAGNLLSTIAQAGMVAEMVALLWFAISELHINQARMTIESERQMFGQGFENLGQERRVEILAGFGIIEEEQVKHFTNVRKLRRRYLHFYTQKHNNIDNDALSAFDSAAALVANLIDLTIDEGKAGMRPALLKYVEKNDKA